MEEKAGAMKFRVTIAVSLMALLLPLSTLNVSAGPTGMDFQQNPDDTFSISGDFVTLEYNGDSAPTFESFRISKNSVGPIYEPLFESIDVQNFIPISSPTLSDQSVVVSSSDLDVEFHNNPMATVSIDATDQALVTFTMEEEIGAIVDAGLAQLGKGGTTGELVVSGDATLEKSFNQIHLRMGDGGRCVFRATVVSPDEYIGSEISSGVVLGELHMMQIDQNVDSDLVQYQSVSMSPSFVSTEKAVVDVSGDFPDGGVIVLMLDRAMFGVAAEDIVVHVDDSETSRASSIDEVLAGADKPAFFASENQATLEVFLYLPHFSDHQIVLAGDGPTVFPWSSLAAVVGATFVLLVATVYLFKSRD
jgi:hypothetical protein